MAVSKRFGRGGRDGRDSQSLNLVVAGDWYHLWSSLHFTSFECIVCLYVFPKYPVFIESLEKHKSGTKQFCVCYYARIVTSYEYVACKQTVCIDYLNNSEKVRKLKFKVIFFHIVKHLDIWASQYYANMLRYRHWRGHTFCQCNKCICLYIYD